MLRCSLGTTLARMGDAGGAIKGLQAAIRADQANPLARLSWRACSWARSASRKPFRS